MRNTKLEVDIKKLNQNLEEIKKYVGNKTIMPVIKANAYGTYINKRLDIINNFDIVAVAIVEEAIELRELGYKKEIFVLNQPSIEELDNIIKYDITVGLCDLIFLTKLNNIDSKIKVHLEIETGMNRTGISIENLNEFIKILTLNKNILVEGVYTHLSSADYDKNYTLKQLNKFKYAVNIINKRIDTIKFIHSSASNGLINYNDNISNLVRPGMILYGYKTFDNIDSKIKLEPIAKLKTKITFIKEIEKGESISYSRSFISKDKMKIATIPIGYADGLNRNLSNNGEVVINNNIAKIVGNICMDSCMIDITNIPNAENGTEVYIWDNENITLEDIANKCNTINYEILSTISNRVPRDFI